MATESVRVERSGPASAAAPPGPGAGPGARTWVRIAVGCALATRGGMWPRAAWAPLLPEPMTPGSRRIPPEVNRTPLPAVGADSPRHPFPLSATPVNSRAWLPSRLIWCVSEVAAAAI